MVAPSVPGAINISQLTGSEIVALATLGPQSAQTTTRAIADLALTPTGNTWFVNATTGKDTNSGSAAAPFATLDAALAAAVANNGDVIYLQGTQHRTTSLAWNKNGVSLFGVNAPSANNRARISVDPAITQAQATALTSLVNVTGTGCAFVNISAFYGLNGMTPPVSPVCWAEAGGRNYYGNVQFFGGGDVLTAAIAGMRSLTLAGPGENLFDGCTIGLDTIARATAVNASLEFLAASASARNQFRGCTFPMMSSLTTNLFVLVGAGSLLGLETFSDCVFYADTFEGGSQLAVGFTVNAAAGGAILLKNPTSVGVTAFATSGNIYIDGTVPSGNGATIGIAVKAT